MNDHAALKFKILLKSDKNVGELQYDSMTKSLHDSIHDEDEQVIKAGLKTWVEEYRMHLSSKSHAGFVPETTTIH